MKANELMLGDIITFKDSVEIDETPIPVKVIALGYQHHGNENEALVQIWDDETCDIVTIDDDFVGYPLTPEILEKNFPTAGELAWWPVEDGLHCESRNTEDIMASGVFRFVHQLQHALRLCGIEKGIKL